MPENNPTQQNGAAAAPVVPVPNAPLICPTCHQPVQPEFYYCPNCGAALRAKPLSTSVGTQAWIYFLSIIMPFAAFLLIGYWPGIKYLRSQDERAKQVGLIAVALLAISTIVTLWISIVWIQATVQSSLNSVGNLGGL